MTPERQRGDAGYTLVELLVVLGILALLTAIATPAYLHYLDSGRVKTARTEIANISVGLDMFKTDNGRFPTTQEGLEALLKAPTSLPTWDGPYINKASGVTDPWGKPYLYKSPGAHGEYDLYSFGTGTNRGEKPLAANW